MVEAGCLQAARQPVATGMDERTRHVPPNVLADLAGYLGQVGLPTRCLRLHLPVHTSGEIPTQSLGPLARAGDGQQGSGEPWAPVWAVHCAEP